MNIEDFETRLKKASLSKKDFARLAGIHHGTVSNWNQSNIPVWVDSWLANYAKAQAFDLIADKVDEVRKG